MTDGQVLRIVADRDPGKPEWRPTQVQRLKAKYVTRPGKPAARFELLRVLHTGRPGRGRTPGSPSVYEVTGLGLLLTPGRPPAADPLPGPQGVCRPAASHRGTPRGATAHGGSP